MLRFGYASRWYLLSHEQQAIEKSAASSAKAPSPARAWPAPPGLHANNSLRRSEETRLEPDRRYARQAGGLSLCAASMAPPSPRAEEIINEARNGRMFILVDDEDRENEGDLVIPAQMATPDAINFMATHGRGLDLPRPDAGPGPATRPRSA